MKAFVPESDDDLLNAFHSGNKEAFEIIYDRYWLLLIRHANHMLNDEEEAKDVVQEVFTALWSRSDSLPSYPNLAAFLYAVTRNRILNRLKHFKIEAKYLAQVEHIIQQPSQMPDSRMREQDLKRVIEEGLNSLPPKMREVFELSRKQHKTHKEIAEQLNISDKTVKKQINNALRILKSKMGDSFNIFLTFF
ncbi:RNA polymerase sigma factor [Pedobacter sp. D749]|jgi:RNA polymerase sigma-70 factor (ECF subfamily)|uniref:RNA polymerase sigma factor n=1 Tax=Pedobacter sp. D749 TaxID=2856523 RepID=UPI001C58085A|nr:RNA polymerase sigma-70 factor [Pedobacter sp. D749]QXU43945.1 RNA polymerase sigma-70 factor [Pedobacter sp. D749]